MDKDKNTQDKEITLRESKQNEKMTKKDIVKELVIYAMIFFVTLFVVPHYVAESVMVDGESMESTLYDRERLIGEKITVNLGEIKRFDIIYFDPHNDIDKYWIKRVIGLPNETIQIIGEDIYINGKILEENYGKDPIDCAGIAKEPITLGPDEYFVLGDNREISDDSRYHGPLPKKDIEGKAIFRFWPFSEFGTIE